jgi:hypothetical protein
MTDLVTGVVYTGRSIFRKNFNLNMRNSNVSFGEAIAVKGSDGSTVHLHRMGHMTVNANGRITASIDKVKLRCR